MALSFKVTYATIAADNEELQAAFDTAFETVRSSWLGVEVPMFIDGAKVYATEKSETHSPVDTSLHLCTAQKGTSEHAKSAVAAAKAAAPAGKRHPGRSGLPSCVASPTPSATTASN